MKKFICFLLSFIVLLTSLVVPTVAASEDVSKLVIIRGFLNRNTILKPYGEWYEVSTNVFFGSDFNNIDGSGQYVIGNSVSSNPVGDYCSFIKIYNEDNSSLSTNKQDLRFELNGLWDYYMMGNNPNSPNFYLFDGSKANKISVIVKDLSGNSHSIENFTFNTKVNSDGSWKLSLDIPSQDIDIYHVYLRLYFNIYDISGTTILPNVWEYGFTESASAVIDLEPADKSTGLLNTIIEWLKSIWNWITDFFETLSFLLGTMLGELANVITNALDNVKTAITNTIEKIQNWLIDLGNSIIDGLKSLFIPDENFINDKFTALREKFNSKLGILSLPFTVLNSLLNAYSNIGSGDGSVRFPTLKLFNVTFFLGGHFDLKDLIDTVCFSINEKVGFDIWNTYYTFVDAIIVLGLLNFIKRKYRNIIMN